MLFIILLSLKIKIGPDQNICVLHHAYYGRVSESAPIEIACKMGVTKSSFSRLQTPWLIQDCHFLEVQDISDHSSGRNIYGHPESSEKMAAEVGQ